MCRLRSPARAAGGRIGTFGCAGLVPTGPMGGIIGPTVGILIGVAIVLSSAGASGLTSRRRRSGTDNNAGPRIGLRRRPAESLRCPRSSIAVVPSAGAGGSTGAERTGATAASASDTAVEGRLACSDSTQNPFSAWLSDPARFFWREATPTITPPKPNCSPRPLTTIHSVRESRRKKVGGVGPRVRIG